MPELPTLDSDLQLLEMDGDSIGALHSLVVDHLLLNPGQAYWVDTHGQIAPHHLARVAPSLRVLDRVQVARGFTPYQHYTLIDRLARRVDADAASTNSTSTTAERDSSLNEMSEPPISLVVVSALDGLYRDESDLRGGRREGREMFLHSLATLGRLARQHDLSMLVLLSHKSNFTAPATRAVTRTIRCEQTRLGPRFTVDGDTADDRFETLVYPLGNGIVQTTLAFWREVLAARAPLYEETQSTAGPLSASVGSLRGTQTGEGSEVMADGAGTY